MSAKQRWGEIQGRRSAVLKRARDASALTIPALLPPDGTNDTSELLQPYQSLGARGVNNLSSKLLLALLPANTAFFRIKIDEDVAKQLGGKKAQYEEKLSAIERKVVHRVETSNLRPILGETIKHLIVAGNALLYLPEKAGSRMYRLDQFCVVRDAAGTVLEAVIKEQVHPSTLPEETRAACGVKPEATAITNIDVFTHIEWKDGRVTYYEEINDVRVPGSDGDHPEAKTPWIILRWTAVANNDYGRGLVEEYIGDLRSLEGISEAIVAFAAVAAKILIMVKPNSTTRVEDINNAETGEAVTGDINDLAFLQLEKHYDFQIAKQVHDDLTLRLSHAFLLRSGTVRDAERVTAEEIRNMAQELEDVLGGTYTVLASELQLPLVRRLLAVLTKEGTIPALPDGAAEPVIVTGFEALGRNHSTNKLRAFLADAASTLGSDVVQQYINADVVLKLLGTGHGVEGLDEVIKTPEQVEADQQNNLNASLSEAAAGPVAGQLARAMTTQPA